MIITGKDFEMIFIGSMSFDFEKKNYFFAPCVTVWMELIQMVLLDACGP